MFQQNPHHLDVRIGAGQVEGGFSSPSYGVNVDSTLNQELYRFGVRIPLSRSMEDRSFCVSGIIAVGDRPDMEVRPISQENFEQGGVGHASR